MGALVREPGSPTVRKAAGSTSRSYCPLQPPAYAGCGLAGEDRPQIRLPGRSRPRVSPVTTAGLRYWDGLAVPGELQLLGDPAARAWTSNSSSEVASGFKAKRAATRCVGA